MQIEWYNYLKKTSEYKQFKKKSRTRSIVALIIISAFWAIIVAATDFNNIDDASMIYKRQAITQRLAPGLKPL